MSYSLVQVPVFLDYSQNNPEYLNALNDYLKLTNQFEMGTRQFIGGMPITLENDCFKELLRVDSENKYAYNITLKVDGERYLLFLSSWGNLYLIDRLLNFFIFLNESGQRLPAINDVPKFLIDGELVNNGGSYEYLIFDLLFAQNQDYLSLNYTKRYEGVVYILDYVLNGYIKFIQSNINISLKRWFPITDIVNNSDIYKYIITETNKNRTTKLKADGLILQPFDTQYVPYGPWNKYNNIQFKWKPVEDQTMDFKIKILTESRWELLTKYDYPFTIPGSGVPATCKPTKDNKLNFKDGDVAEFTYSGSGSEFKIFRARPNKEANSLGSVLSVWNFIKNPFTLDVLRKPLEILNKENVDKKEIKSVLSVLSKSQLILTILFDRGIFFNKYEVRKIKDLYSKFVYSNELECRIFKNGKQPPSVGEYTFKYLWDFLVKNYEMKNMNSIDIIELSDSYKKARSSYKSVEDIYNKKSIINETKTPIQSVISNASKQKLYNNLIFKLSLSEELKTNNLISLKKITKENPSGFNNMIRFKNRYSFKLNELWVIDLTIVKTGYSLEDAASKNDVYEMECEFTGEKIPFEHFIKSFSNIYMFILSNTGFC